MNLQMGECEHPSNLMTVAETPDIRRPGIVGPVILFRHVLVRPIKDKETDDGTAGAVIRLPKTNPNPITNTNCPES